MQLILKHLQSPLPPLNQYRENIPEAVDVVLATATAKDPETRYASMTDFSKAFQYAIHATES